jgi:uncharacterized repeat protein (TIGR03803 family)
MPNRKRQSHLHFAILGLCLICALSAKSAGSDTLLYSFNGAMGANPYGALVADSAGNLYGTTFAGGFSSAGTIFKLDAANGYSESVLYNFTGMGDGGFPIAGLIIDSSGNLYGTTSCGGISQCNGGSGGYGVVFVFSPSSGYSVLYPFAGGTDGGNPVASLTFDSAMNLIGTTEAGGIGRCLGQPGCGVVFELSAANGYHTETVLYSFMGVGDGGVPKAPVIFNASKTTLYGTTYAGGSGACLGTGNGCGVVFQLSPSGTEKVLHQFTGKGDGSLPVAPLIFNQTGTVLYGTASAGGKTSCSGGCGIVFQLSGTSLTTLSNLHSFAGPDGADPKGGLALYTSPTLTALYGTTFGGGTVGLGVIFQLVPTTRGYTLVHSFTGLTGTTVDGANPFAGLILGYGLPGVDSVFPPTRKGCPSKCSGTSVAGGTNNLGTAYSD